MKYQVTVETEGMLGALDVVRRLLQSRLHIASPAAREEWVNLLLRLPTDEDVGKGVIEVSLETLTEMVSKARRFEQILKAACGPEAVAFPQAAAPSVTSYPEEPIN